MIGILNEQELGKKMTCISGASASLPSINGISTGMDVNQLKWVRELDAELA